MSEYSQLKEMGVLHPEEIRTYMVNSISGIDVLRIIYERHAGSLLPASRSYEFPRVQRTITDDAGKSDSVMETAPPLREAVNELKALMEERKEKTDVKSVLLQEVESLERELACRVQQLKKLLKEA